MKTLTLKGIDTRIHAWLKRRAARHHRSINGELLHILDRMSRAEATAGPEGAGLLMEGEPDDLDALAGTWSDRDVEEFERNSMNKIVRRNLADLFA